MTSCYLWLTPLVHWENRWIGYGGESIFETQNDREPKFAIEKDPYFFAIRAICTRWKPFIIQGIRFDGKTRFSTFTKQLPISEKVLAVNLRELETDGIIQRKIYPEIPPRVEYRLTELGLSICPMLDALYKWGWNEMKRRGLPIDPLGEMWHGYRERDESLMKKPFK